MLTTQVGMTLLNIPYVWGGKNPLYGFDCSGLIQWIMTSVGFVIEGGPRNAQGLNSFFLQQGVKVPATSEGALVFYGEGSAIDHVGLCIDNKRMIEAFNGNEYCTSRNIAQMRGACSRVSPIKIRPDLQMIVMPDYPSIGL